MKMANSSIPQDSRLKCPLFRRQPFSLPWIEVYASYMPKQPLDESKNRFSEVIRQSQERRAELNNKNQKKQMDDVELPPRDEEIVDTSDLKDDEPAV
jgi:hypothetical protein